MLKQMRQVFILDTLSFKFHDEPPLLYDPVPVTVLYGRCNSVYKSLLDILALSSNWP